MEYIDFNVFYEDYRTGLWHNTKNLILDSILVLNYIRNKTDGLPMASDSRVLSLIDLCEKDRRNDYFERFLYYDKEVYHNCKNLWWVDCWHSIRLNNILSELKVRSLIEYFGSSDGEKFKEKWENFFKMAKSERFGKDSLPAFSYLECMRFFLNLGKPFPIEDFTDFCHKISEIKDLQLSYFPKSNEIRSKTLSIIQYLNRLHPEMYNLQQESADIYKILKYQLNKCKWDGYSHTLAPIILELENVDLHNVVYNIIPPNGIIENKWISGADNFTRKPRFSLLGIIKNIHSKTLFFDIIYPYRAYNAPNGFETDYSFIAQKTDMILQGLKDVKDIQKKIQDDNVKEEYFRDLIKFGLQSAADQKGEFQWTEKEHMTTSGRKADIYIIRRRSCDVPVEIKLLWRFPEGYEPINENLDQIREGDFGIIIVINPPNNPCYKNKYQGFDGWKAYIMNHESYISGTLKKFEEGKNIISNLKSFHTISDHHYSVGVREKNYSILSFFIELNDYTRSSELSKI